MPAVEYTKQFITSVVVGKDVVPRIGLHQMESLRADLINAIKRSKDPKVSLQKKKTRKSLITKFGGSLVRPPFCPLFSGDS